jgi:hypothetical protein
MTRSAPPPDGDPCHQHACDPATNGLSRFTRGSIASTPAPYSWTGDGPNFLLDKLTDFRGSQTGSQRRQTLGDVWRRLAAVNPVSWHERRHQATFRDGPMTPYKRGVTGSNPVAPTKSSEVDAVDIQGSGLCLFRIEFSR